MKYQFIEQHRQHWPVSRLCQVLEISSSGYYAWRQRTPSPRTVANQALLEKINQIHQASHGTYGSPRVHAELRAQGQSCGLNRVARLMRLNRISAKQHQRRRRTTLRDETHPVAPNLLDRQFEAAAPNQKWLADISYIPTQEGDLYLAVVLDLFSRKVVGWAMAASMTAQLSCQALQMALAQCQLQPGLLHHSDQGSQYTATAYQSLLKREHCQISMSRVGNCYDNAPMESFFGTLKTELIHHRLYLTRAEARTDIFYYLEIFYNRQPRHSALGYLCPEQFEKIYFHSLN